MTIHVVATVRYATIAPRDRGETLRAFADRQGYPTDLEVDLEKLRRFIATQRGFEPGRKWTDLQ